MSKNCNTVVVTGQIRTQTIQLQSKMYQFRSSKSFQIAQLITVVILITCSVFILGDRNGDVTFQFPEYDYKETSKNVIDFAKFIDLFRMKIEEW